MNILIYGLQSSGASLIAYTLAQLTDALGIIDLWHPEKAPALTDVDCRFKIVKCVVNADISVEEHIHSFRPDIKILALRHPHENFASLRVKEYANAGGYIPEKFMRLDKILVSAFFDAVVRYEDFIQDPRTLIRQMQQLDIPLISSHLAFPRRKEDILKFNSEKSAWCARFYRSKWGFGNMHFQNLPELRPLQPFRLNNREVRMLESVCPNLYKAYCDFDLSRRKSRALLEEQKLLPKLFQFAKGLVS